MATQQEKISAIQDILNSQYSSTRWKTFLSELFTSSNFFSNPTPLLGINATVASQALQIGSITIIQSGISRNIAVYEVTLADNVVLERNRVGLRNLLKPHWKQQDAAFIVYHHPQDKSWRFSYVSELKTFNEAGEYVDNKTEPKRYTYVLGENESCRTAAIQFSKLQDKASNATLDDIKEAFSVEKMSKEFFDTYKDHYQDFVQYLTGKRLEKVSGKWEEVVKHAPNTQLITIFNNNEKDVRDFCKKLLGRIVFLYFIQKKGWLGVPLHDKWGNGKPDFISRLLANCRNPSIFYSEYLSKLFFETLNQPRPDDLAEVIPGEKTRVPYLNGGLFEEDDPNQRGLIFEAELFKDLFTFFDQYNFTIYEDDPNDHTVAVDPEMLGHIFENLLEDNKDKGAYYTPKEIVHYMCQESLIEYLTTWFEGKNYQVQQDTFISFDNAQQASFLSANEGRTGQSVLEIAQSARSTGKMINRSLIEKLLKKQLSDEDKQAVIEHAAEFNEALDKVKVCDPAIGSGAFPMGLLLEIFTAKQTIHTFTHGDLTTFEPATVKLNIIQNSIYGVDIERGAVDIARLRFWLSLVVDEPEPQPLPNLDYKIVVGNSLISKLGNEVIEIDWDVKPQDTGLFGADDANKIQAILKQLSQLQKEFFDPSTRKKEHATKIRDLKIDLLIEQLNLMIKNGGAITPKQGTKKSLDVAKLEGDLQIAGYKQQLVNLNILKNSPEIPLDFFDWRLNFAEILIKDIADRRGFDIVIGNPPYFNIDTFGAGSEMLKLLPRKYPEVYMDKSDILFYFISVAQKITSAQVSFIISNAMLFSDKAKKLRNFMIDNLPIQKIINFERYMVFNSASITSMMIFMDKHKKGETVVQNFKESSYEINTLLGDFRKNENYYSINFRKDNVFALVNSLEDNLINKIDSKHRRLGEIFKVGKGMETAANEVFCFNNYPENFNKSIIKKRMSGEIIEKYTHKDSIEYLIYFEHAESFSNLPVEVKNHLNAHKLKLESRATVKNEGRAWWRYSRPMHKEFYHHEKIWCSYRAKENVFCLDETNDFIGLTNTTAIFATNQEFNIKYVLALLNSKILNYRYKSIGKQTGSGVFEYFENQVSKLPIASANYLVQKKFSDLIDLILKNKKLNLDTKDIEHKIDYMSYKLYNLSYVEVKVIDPNFDISEAEYNAIVI